MKYYLLLVLCALAHNNFAQVQTYDLITFTPPRGWNKTSLENAINFSTTDNSKRTWAQISIVKSTTSKGTIKNDFQSEWIDLAVKPYGVSEQPIETHEQTFNGWQLFTGLGKFVFNNDTANLLLNTFSDNQRCISLIVMSNTTAYGPTLDKFLASISLPPVTVSPANSTSSLTKDTSEKKKIEQAQTGNTAPLVDSFQFNETNFDDGWTSVVKADWVEATKGNIKVLLHYPRKEDAEYIPQQVDHTRMFWNLLVAPRYTNLTDFFLYSYNMSYQPGHFASGYMLDKNGRRQFVALFMKGKSGWIEIIAPDKDTFVRNFGVDQPDSYFDKWEALVNLSGLNRFAVGENDLAGKWSSDFTGSMQYYSTFTGLYTGYNAYSSRETYTFRSNKTYDWKLSTANSTNGQTVAQNTESSGTFAMKGNWQLVCSKIQDGPRTYNAYFSCIKGGRVLWLQDLAYGNYTPYGKVAP